MDKPRTRRTITPARLYREIDQFVKAHELGVEFSTVKELLDALLLDVLKDALDE